LGIAVTHDAPVELCRILSHDSQALTASEYDAKLWNITTGRISHSYSPSGGLGKYITASWDGTRIAAVKSRRDGTEGGDVVMYRFPEGRSAQELHYVGNPDGLYFSPDDAVLVVSEWMGDKHRVHLWDLKQGRERCGPITSDCRNDLKPQLGHVPVAFCGDKSWVAIAHSTWFEIVNLADGKRVSDNFNRAGGEDSPTINALAVSRDGTSIAVLREGDVRIWDAKRGDPIKPEIDAKIFSFSLDSAARLIVGTYSSSETNRATRGAERAGIWDLSGGQWIGDLNQKSGGWSFGFSPKGDYVAAGTTRSVDVSIWNIE
jgi:WD40 repeat protein